MRPRWPGDHCVEYATARLRGLRGRELAAAFASRPVVEYGAKNARAEHAGSARHAVSRLSVYTRGKRNSTQWLCAGRGRALAAKAQDTSERGQRWFGSQA